MESVIGHQEGDAFTIEGIAHGFQMHQMCGPADLDVAFDRRSSESVEQPARVLIRDKSIPFAADDRDRRLHQSRIIGEIAVPGVQDIGKRPGRSLHSGRVATATVGIGVEIALAPFVEVRARQNRPFVRAVRLR